MIVESAACIEWLEAYVAEVLTRRFIDAFLTAPGKIHRVLTTKNLINGG